MTTELTYDNYLAHYGIKGMRWGVRRKTGSDGTVTGDVATKDKSKMAKPTRKEKREERRKLKAPNKSYTPEQRRKDNLKYGGHAVRRVNRDMNRGDSYNEALGKEMKYRKKSAAATAALVAAVYFSPEIANVAVKGYSGLHNAAYEKKSQRNKAEAGRRAANAFSNDRGIANYRVIDLNFDSKANIWR